MTRIGRLDGSCDAVTSRPANPTSSTTHQGLDWKLLRALSSRRTNVDTATPLVKVRPRWVRWAAGRLTSMAANAASTNTPLRAIIASRRIGSERRQPKTSSANAGTAAKTPPTSEPSDGAPSASTAAAKPTIRGTTARRPQRSRARPAARMQAARKNP